MSKLAGESESNLRKGTVLKKLVSHFMGLPFYKYILLNDS